MINSTQTDKATLVPDYVITQLTETSSVVIYDDDASHTLYPPDWSFLVKAPDGKVYRPEDWFWREWWSAEDLVKFAQRFPKENVLRFTHTVGNDPVSFDVEYACLVCPYEKYTYDVHFRVV